jgi:hypothetical protein
MLVLLLSCSPIQDKQQATASQCTSTKCSINRPKTIDDRYFYGPGWDIVLPENWGKTPPQNDTIEFSATYVEDNKTIIASISVIDFDGICFYDFSRERIETLTKDKNVALIDKSIVNVGGVNNVAIVFMYQESIIGIQTYTSFDKKGYTMSCVGTVYDENDVVFVLDRCSDFANSISFNIKRGNPPVDI